MNTLSSVKNNHNQITFTKNKSPETSSQKRKLEDITNSFQNILPDQKKQKNSDESCTEDAKFSQPLQFHSVSFSFSKSQELTFDDWYAKMTKPLNLSQHQLTTAIDLLRKYAGFNLRMAKFQKLFCKAQHSLKITLNEALNGHSLSIRLTKGKYDSKGIKEEYLEKSNTHFHIKVYECDAHDKISDVSQPILQLRACEKHGELAWIQKGNSITGTEVCDLYKIFERVFAGINMYVFDDSKVEFTVAKKKNPLTNYLRIFLPLGRSNAKTWYEDLGYDEVTICKDWKDPHGLPINQQADTYKNDLEYLRQLKMCEIYKIYQDSSKLQQTKITPILKMVFPEFKNSKKAFRECTKTLHELISGLIKLKRDGIISENELNIMENDIQDALIREMPWHNPNGNDRYIEATKTIFSTVIRNKTVL